MEKRGGSLLATSRLFGLTQTGTLEDHFNQCLRIFAKVTEPSPMQDAEQVRAFLGSLSPPFKSHALGVIKDGAKNLAEAHAMLGKMVPVGVVDPSVAAVEADLDAM